MREFVYIDDIIVESSSEEEKQAVKQNKPDWLRIQYRADEKIWKTAKTLNSNLMNTICVEGACPNRHECWGASHAAFLIMGDVCTRSCKFCNVKNGRPNKLDNDEPERLANTILELGIEYVVITSVDRDDLPDGGANHFVKCIQEIRKLTPKTKIELLTPDFRKVNLANDEAHLKIAAAGPDVFGHNIETVARLHKQIRPAARYFHSMRILHDVKKNFPSIVTKSGMMLGLGEKKEEILQAFSDLRSANVECITIGQYLRPSEKNHPVIEYVHPKEFEMYADEAKKAGFAGVSSGPFVRTSYKAFELYSAAIKKQKLSIAE